jgi:ATP-binding cassette subfamily F protein 3
VYETLASGSPLQMVPMIRNILGGFLFSGDDVYKHVRVLSGGERTRLAVARMLLRPSNTLLLDEPTNHLDLDSKEVLLDALVDYGGTLIFVSHDRYFVERLATKIIEVGNGTAVMFPGTYKEFLYHKAHAGEAPVRAEARKADTAETRPQNPKVPAGRGDGKTAKPGGRQPSRDANAVIGSSKGHSATTSNQSHEDRKQSHEDKKRADAEARKKSRELQARQQRIDSLESRIAETEAAIRELEQQMSAPGFYDDRVAAQPVVDRHQALMWQVGDLMHQWEELQTLVSQPQQS